MKLKPCSKCGAQARIKCMDYKGPIGSNKKFIFAYVTCENDKCNNLAFSIENTEAKAAEKAANWWNKNNG